MMRFYVERPRRVAAVRVGDENGEALLAVDGVRRLAADIYVIGQTVMARDHWLVLPGSPDSQHTVMDDAEFRATYQLEEETPS